LTPSNSSHWSHCSGWGCSKDDDNCIYGDCPDKCNSDGDCISECAKSCAKIPCDGLYEGNRINYEIKHDGNSDDTRTLTYDICYNAYKTELGGCKTGSEQNHDGFWFRIDPNPRTCDASY